MTAMEKLGLLFLSVVTIGACFIAQQLFGG